VSERFDREASLAVKAARASVENTCCSDFSTARLRRGNCCWLSTSIRWHCAEQCCGHWQTAGSVQDLP